MKKIIFTLLVSCTFLWLNAQSESYDIKQVTDFGSSNSTVVKVVADESGNYFVYGHLYQGSDTAFIQGDTILPERAYVLKFNDKDSLLWSTTFRHTSDWNRWDPKDMVINRQGNVYFSGTFGDYGRIYFDNENRDSISLRAATDPFFVKLDGASGAVEFARNIGGTNWAESGPLAVDDDGAVYHFVIVRINFHPDGVTQINTGTDRTLALIKYNPVTDAPMWHVLQGGGNSRSPSALFVDKQKNIYLSGYYEEDKLTWDDFDLPQPWGKKDGFIVKLNEATEVQWMRSLRTPEDVDINDIFVNSDEEVYLTATFRSTECVFLGSTLIIPSDMELGLLVSKISADGESIIWANTAGIESDNGRDGKINSVYFNGDNVLLSGTIQGSRAITFRDGQVVRGDYVGNHRKRLFYAELNDANGNVNYAQAFNHTSAGIDFLSNNGSIDPNGNFWVGSFSASGTLTFGSNPSTSFASNGLVIAKFRKIYRPTKPVISLVEKDSSSVKIEWTASTAKDGLLGYYVYQNDVDEIYELPFQIAGPIDSLNYLVTGLDANTAYEFYVVAEDYSSNRTSSDTITVTTDMTTSTNFSLKEEGLRVYPNPSTGIINIAGLNNKERISIVTLDGRELANMINDSQETLSLQVDYKGFVIVRITDSSKTVTQKLLIK